MRRLFGCCRSGTQEPVLWYRCGTTLGWYAVSNLREKTMGIATEILSLRRNQTSSVKTLLGALEWTMPPR